MYGTSKFKMSTTDVEHVGVPVDGPCVKGLWPVIHQKYESLKNLTDLINNVHGLSITCFLVVSVLEYAIGLDEFFVERKETVCAKLVVGCFFLEKCAVVLVAADICRLVSVICYLT